MEIAQPSEQHARRPWPTLWAIFSSLALGLYALLVVPLYFALNPIDPPMVRLIDGVAVGNLVLFAGESPIAVFLGLILLPALLWIGTRLTLVVAIGLSLLVGLGQLGSILFAVTDPTVPFWELAPQCTLITCGLAHSLFHFLQVPPLLVVAVLSMRTLMIIREKGQ